MEIKLYGTRGSIPVPSTENFSTIEFGGNTTCVTVKGVDGSLHIIDAGTGIRRLGQEILKEFPKGGLEANIYFTHTHHDHIQGLPFFAPAYNPTNNIRVFGEKKLYRIDTKTHDEEYLDFDAIMKKDTDLSSKIIIQRGIKEALKAQQNPQHFPVDLKMLQAIKGFESFLPNGSVIYQSGFLKVEAMGVNHHGGCVSYKFTESFPTGETKSFVFSTDFEPHNAKYDHNLKSFWEDADLVIADSQYEHPDEKNTKNPFMEGWGHSDFKTNIMFARDSGVRNLVLTHHEPKMDDSYHRNLEERATVFFRLEAVASKLSQVSLAREGTSYNLI